MSIHHVPISNHPVPTGFLPVSAPAYFALVILMTGVGISMAMRFNPALLHAFGQRLGWERAPEAAPNSFYAVRVAPILGEHCTSCHGARRQKAQLRLDSLATTLRGSKHGLVVKAGSPRGSELITRITLPPSNVKAMPPEGKPALSADEITVIRLWVAAGASGALPVDAIQGAPKPVMEVKFPEIDEAQVQRQRAALAGAVKTLLSRFPGAIVYESRESANLEVNASLLRGSFGDQDVQALAPLKDRIVWADFSGTMVGDASASALATFKHLRVLHLSDTRITDATIEAMASLSALQSLTVVGTAVTAQGLTRLRQSGVAVYTGQETQGPADGTH
jgi:hypothetical protein